MRLTKFAHYFLMGFYFVFVQTLTGQDQREADRLVQIYKLDTVNGLAKLALLKDLSFNEINDFDTKLGYAEELITLALSMENFNYLYYGYYLKGEAKQFTGNLEEAISAYFESIEIAKKGKLISSEGAAYGAVADIYTISENHETAMLYYGKAISTLRKSKDTIALASFILNAGDALLTNKKYDSALTYFKESGALFEQADYVIGKAYNLGNIGMVYANTGKNELAERNINDAVRILEESQDYYPISVYLMAMADIYVEKEDLQIAIDYSLKSLELAKEYGLKEQLADANLKLSELYESAGDSITAYNHYKDFITHRDELNNIEAVQQRANLRTDFEVSQKQVQVALLETKARNQLIILCFIGFGFLASLWFYRVISKEKKKSEKLLLNILPEDTAKELKINGKVKAKQYDSVSVLFTDFKGFTSYSEKLSPEALVETVDFYFSKFDAIIEKHGLEKIKTIGDAYMCAGGLHHHEKTHAENTVAAGIEIAEFVEHTKKDINKTDLTFDIRIGISTGPVVAGVVGTKKFAYDIWGDTVNVAARMESMSEPGKINISEYTYALVKDDYDCEFRGEIEVKNRGVMKMFFVNF